MTNTQVCDINFFKNMPFSSFLLVNKIVPTSNKQDNAIKVIYGNLMYCKCCVHTKNSIKVYDVVREP